MTAAIDRFLYRATADVVIEHLEDARCDLEAAYWDLANVRENQAAKKADLIAHIDELSSRVSEVLAAIERAELHLSDFVEANRPC